MEKVAVFEEVENREAVEVEQFNAALKETEQDLLHLSEMTMLFNKLIGDSGVKLQVCEHASRKGMISVVRGVDVLKKALDIHSNEVSTSLVLIPLIVGSLAGGPAGALISLSATGVLGGAAVGGGLGAVSGWWVRNKLS